MTRILRRSAWTSSSPGGRRFNHHSMRGIVCHYPASGRDIGVISQSHEARRLRGWRNYHVHGHGWADIGYNYAISQAGRVWEARGARVGAHTIGHNSRWVGVLFIVGNDESLSPAAEKAFRDLRAHLRRKGIGSRVYGHKQMSGQSTNCPGRRILYAIRTGRLTGSGNPSITTGGGSNSSGWRHVHYGDTLHEGTHGDPVKDVQRILGISADGYYGAKTVAAVRAFQTNHHLTVDGIVGDHTWNALHHTTTTPSSARHHGAPAFPLPRGWYFGWATGPRESVSGYHSHRRDLQRWQEAANKYHGKHLAVDGYYGAKTARAAKAIQRRAHLRVDGLIGTDTWNATWT